MVNISLPSLTYSKVDALKDLERLNEFHGKPCNGKFEVHSVSKTVEQDKVIIQTYFLFVYKKDSIEPANSAKIHSFRYISTRLTANEVIMSCSSPYITPPLSFPLTFCPLTSVDSTLDKSFDWVAKQLGDESLTKIQIKDFLMQGKAKVKEELKTSTEHQVKIQECFANQYLVDRINAYVTRNQLDYIVETNKSSYIDSSDSSYYSRYARSRPDLILFSKTEHCGYVLVSTNNGDDEGDEIALNNSREEQEDDEVVLLGAVTFALP